MPSSTGKPAARSTFAAAGSMLTKLLAVMSTRSAERKKNVRSLRIGPPSVAPHWFWLKGDLSRLMAVPKTSNFSKWSLAFKESSRTKAKTLPLSSFVPLLVTMLTTPPEALPNSAE